MLTRNCHKARNTKIRLPTHLIKIFTKITFNCIYYCNPSIYVVSSDIVPHLRRMIPDPLYQALRMYDDLVEIRRQSALVETEPDLRRGPWQFLSWHTGRLGLTEVGIKASEGNDSNEKRAETTKQRIMRMLAGYEGIPMEKKRFLSRHNSVLDL